MLRPTVGALLALAALTPPSSGRDVIKAMHDRYAGKWYRTLTFLQHNTATGPDGGTERSVWREYLKLPGKLRVEVVPPDSGADRLFVRDSQFVLGRDRPPQAMAFVHPLMVLGFDVYFDPVERTVARLERLGFDLALVHTDTWDGRPVYVVGAKPGDRHTRQFWVDQERLVFVRLLEPGRRDSARTSETRFNKYRPLGQAWVSTEVAFLVDGQPRWLEEYADIEGDRLLPNSLFDPARWNR
ncbi:MAG TPA: hypothetical protein VEU55_05805 [Gemmatimonadales bacterium]|nr:hypothetical protein [Gemmatimonadales bacterium]